MSAFTRAFLICDPCGAVLDTSTVPSAENVKQAEQEARAAGWHRRPQGRHICSECWKAGER